MFKLYTKYGDNGETGLLYGGRVSKDDIRCNSYGTVDEIISSLGLARSFSTNEEVNKYLRVIQVELFTVGSELATDVSMYETMKSNFKVIGQDNIDYLEKLLDYITPKLELPRSFVIPGSNSCSAAIDVSRSVARRAERLVVNMHEQNLLNNDLILVYLNRLADTLFALARYAEIDTGFDSLDKAEINYDLGK